MMDKLTKTQKFIIYRYFQLEVGSVKHVHVIHDRIFVKQRIRSMFKASVNAVLLLILSGKSFREAFDIVKKQSRKAKETVLSDIEGKDEIIRETAEKLVKIFVDKQLKRRITEPEFSEMVDDMVEVLKRSLSGRKPVDTAEALNYVLEQVKKIFNARD